MATVLRQARFQFPPSFKGGLLEPSDCAPTTTDRGLVRLSRQCSVDFGREVRPYLTISITRAKYLSSYNILKVKHKSHQEKV